jgi:hypothetical protein
MAFPSNTKGSKYLVVVKEKSYNPNEGTFGKQRWMNFLQDPTDPYSGIPDAAKQWRDFIAVDYSAGDFNAPDSISGDPDKSLICRKTVEAAGSYDLTPSFTDIGSTQDIMFLLQSQLTGGSLNYDANDKLDTSIIYVNSDTNLNSYTVYMGYFNDREVQFIGDQLTGITIGNLNKDNPYVTLEATTSAQYDELSILKPAEAFDNLLKEYLKPSNLKFIQIAEYFDGSTSFGYLDLNIQDDIKIWSGVGCDTTEATIEISSEADDTAPKTFCASSQDTGSTISFNGENSAGTRTVSGSITELENNIGTLAYQLFYGKVGRTSFHDIGHYSLKFIFTDDIGNNLILALPRVAVTPSTSFTNDASKTEEIAWTATKGVLKDGANGPLPKTEIIAKFIPGSNAGGDTSQGFQLNIITPVDADPDESDYGRTLVVQDVSDHRYAAILDINDLFVNGRDITNYKLSIPVGSYIAYNYDNAGTAVKNIEFNVTENTYTDINDWHTFANAAAKSKDVKDDKK